MIKSRNEFYDFVRSIFKEHYRCAFREDLDVSTLDCLTYMAGDIADMYKKEMENTYREKSKSKKTVFVSISSRTISQDAIEGYFQKLDIYTDAIEFYYLENGELILRVEK